jgi:hypothetical protein
MSSWRPLLAGTVGLFLIILAFLAGQLHGGGDPALRTSGSTTTEQTAPQTTPEPQQDSDPQGSGSDPYSAPNGAAPDGIVPRGTTPDLSPPTTEQS